MPPGCSEALQRQVLRDAHDRGASSVSGKSARCVGAQVMQRMPPDVLEFLTAELGFFDMVTDISGALYSVPKDERKAGAVKLAREVRLYVHYLGRLSILVHQVPDSWQDSQDGILLLYHAGRK